MTAPIRAPDSFLRYQDDIFIRVFNNPDLEEYAELIGPILGEVSDDWHKRNTFLALFLHEPYFAKIRDKTTRIFRFQKMKKTRAERYQNREMIRNGQQPNQNSGPATRCIICLEDFEVNAKLRRLPCFHQFHTACIDNSFKIRFECPICRQCPYDYVHKDGRNDPPFLERFMFIDNSFRLGSF